MKFEMSDKVYDILKWVVMIVLPACSALYASLAPVWGWGNVEQITVTLSAIQLFLGSLIGISTSNVKKQKPTKRKHNDVSFSGCEVSARRRSGKC